MFNEALQHVTELLLLNFLDVFGIELFFVIVEMLGVNKGNHAVAAVGIFGSLLFFLISSKKKIRNRVVTVLVRYTKLARYEIFVNTSGLGKIWLGYFAGIKK